MVLRETLTDADIPHRDKVREAIICHWRTSFEDLKLQLSVSLIYIFPPYYLTFVVRKPVAESVLLRTVGQAQTCRPS